MKKEERTAILEALNGMQEILQGITTHLKASEGTEEEQVPAAEAVETVVDWQLVDHNGEIFIVTLDDPYPHLTFAQHLGSCRGKTKAGYPKGLHEVEDKVLLETLFKRYLDMEIDPSEESWCCDLVKLVLAAVGHQVPESRRAQDLLDFGTEGSGKQGDLVIFRNHAGVLERTAPEALIVGGNQSDAINITPMEWYSRYSEFLGFREVPKIEPPSKYLPDDISV